MRFVDVTTRQAHPGPKAPPYQSFAEKAADARRYQEQEGIPWPVLVDDLEGTVHQVYSGLADPTYIIDAEGRIAYFNTWTHAPNLHKAIEALLEQGGRGVVNGGIDRVMHLLPAMTDGWRATRRGLPQSYVDWETAVPGMGASLWLGHQARALLAPLTLRAEPFSPRVRATMALGVLVTALLGIRALRR